MQRVGEFRTGRRGGRSKAFFRSGVTLLKFRSSSLAWFLRCSMFGFAGIRETSLLLLFAQRPL
jgi:hypothetical protein